MYTTTSKQQEGCTFKNSHAKCFITTKSIAKLSPGAMNRGEVLRLCFHHFLLCFHLNFYTSIKLIFYLFETISTEITPQNTLLNMQKVKKTGVEGSLRKIFNPKCFRTTNFDRFREAVSLQHVLEIS
jgi:hypothetical protein